MADISGSNNLYIALRYLKDALNNYKMCSFCENEVKRVEQVIKILEGENN